MRLAPSVVWFLITKYQIDTPSLVEFLDFSMAENDNDENRICLFLPRILLLLYCDNESRFIRQ